MAETKDPVKIIETLKNNGYDTPQSLAEENPRKITEFMKKSGLTYFETFFLTQIEDLREYIEKDEIKIIRVKKGSKIPQDNDYYNKKLTISEIMEHKGNYGVCVGYNHIKGRSLACIDIDGFKIGKITKAQKELLPAEQVELLENLTDERKAEILKESKDYLLTCLIGALPNSMAVRTQSGGYHLYIWNQTHLSDGLEDSFHYVSKRLKFPKDCPIKEIRGLSMLNSLEIFTKFETKQCVLAGSFIKNFKAGITKHYEIMEIPENTRKLGDLGTVKDINKSVRKHLISMGFIWNDNPEDSKGENTNKKGKAGRPKQNKPLNPYGILKELTEEEINEIVNILKPYFSGRQMAGIGHYTVLALGGYFSHTITEDSGAEVLRRLWKASGYRGNDIKTAVQTLRNNYKETRKNKAKTGLKTVFDNIQNRLGLTNDQRESLEKQLHLICYPTIEKANKTEQDLEILIKQSLIKNKSPSSKLIADYINKLDTFFLDYETAEPYKQTSKGFELVDIESLSVFLNGKFGANKLSRKTLEEILKFITEPIGTDYDLIVFNNGTLNTQTEEFKKDWYPLDCLPKLKTELNYIPDAENEYKDTLLYKEFNEILRSDRWKDNEDYYYKSVGVSAMAVNESDCFFIILGEPNHRKTTLLTPLKRIFNYSELKLKTIAKNERFTIIPTLRKDINIDDDLSDTVIKDSGFLRSFISGAGGTVEKKGENIPLELTAETTPKIWGTSNKLPTIEGEGMERRTCLILAENELKGGVKTYQSDILRGKRDPEIALLFSYSLQTYFKERTKQFVTDEMRQEMAKEWEWKSNPANIGVDLLFTDADGYIEYLRELEAKGKVQNIEYDEAEQIITYDIKADNKLGYANVELETWTPVSKVNRTFKKFHKISLRKKKIFREQSRPSTKTIKDIMSFNGFFQKQMNFKDKYGNVKPDRVYEDCILWPNWENKIK